MGSYASDKHALGECARCGAKMPLKFMLNDGYYPNLIVCASCWEPRHPQESLPNVEDPTTLYRPSPENLPAPTSPVLTNTLINAPNRDNVLTWTESITHATKINSYQVWRSTNLAPSAVGFDDSFTKITTINVVRDSFGAITNNPYTYTDPFASVHLELGNFYHYYILAIPVQGPYARSNTLPVDIPPAAVVLSALWNGGSLMDLSWTASSSIATVIDHYDVLRATDAGAFVTIASVSALLPRTYQDTGLDRLTHKYQYKVVPVDALTVRGPDSNIQIFNKLVSPDRLVINEDVLTGAATAWTFGTSSSADMVTSPTQFNLSHLPVLPVYPLPASGKYYWEAKCVGISNRVNSGFNPGYGFSVQAHRFANDDLAAGSNIVAFLDGYEGGTAAGIQIGNGITMVNLPGEVVVVNDVVMVAMDFALKKIWFGKNGAWKGGGTQNPATGQGGFWPIDETSVALAGATSRNWYGPWQSGDFLATPETNEWRFKSSNWSFAPPSGFGQWIVWAPGTAPETTPAFIDPNGTYRLRNFIPGLCMSKALTVNSHQIRSQVQRGAGKRYFEVSQIGEAFSTGAGTQFLNVGITRLTSSNALDVNLTGVAINGLGQVRDFTGSFGTYGSTNYNNTVDGRVTNDMIGGDTYMVAVDFVSQRAFFGMNGVWYNGQDPTSGAGGIPLPVVATDWVAVTSSFSTACHALFNTGGLAFIHTPPAGYQGWDE